MKIREMTPPDLTAVAELYLAANPFASEKEIRTWTSGGLNARPRMNLVAQVRGRIIGAISSTVPDKRTMCIEDIAVLPTYRRKGVGTALMKKMLDHAKESGFKKAVLYVHWQNSAAIPFYHKHGFSLHRIVKANDMQPVPNGEEIISMQRTL